MIRYIVLVLTLVTMSILLANTVLFNFTVICMDPAKRHPDVEMTITNETRYYTPTEEGWIIAAPSVGLVIGTLPSVLMTQRRGLRQTFSLAGLCSGLMTMAYPFVADDIIASLIIRFIQGFAVASAFVAIGIVPIEYGGIKEKGLFVSVLTTAYQLGPFSTIPASSLFCSSSIGWPGVYYAFGATTITSFVLFFVFYRNTAQKNSILSKPRVAPIANEIPKAPKKNRTIPYRKIFLTRSVWGVLNSAISDSVGFLVFFLYGPIYVNKVLKFDVAQTGILAAIPHVIAGTAKLLSGMFLHKSSCMNSPRGITLATFISQKIGIALFIAMAIIGSSMPVVAQILMTLIIMCNAYHFIGVMAAAQAVAQQYTQVLSSSIAAIESVFGLMLPPFVSYLAPDHTAEQWAVILYCVAGILTLTNFAFLFITKVEPAEWTEEQVGLHKRVDSEESA
ncbi:hypothetical protein QR680_010589 [Steinernema hermaphroditum]|uniref:Major facilitator superfamily (MFS) profile domain-containing protein n=1 Tax=Steinernema hermaphroditum TaxID=289476 RepID=A0AA39IPI4_9BILA|nr:hypothetical protein QR680_010589 [Steinernema hermaphroditum]